jgi:hypothetical protein
LPNLEERCESSLYKRDWTPDPAAGAARNFLHHPFFDKDGGRKPI